jgi:carbamoyl-phosphate synthase small subunit
MPKEKPALPSSPNAALLLADGTVFWGQGFGAEGLALGEICFNTAMTGYQEVLTDPSYQGQIITFTFPHIGNVGCNGEDIESAEKPVIGAAGLIVREPITEPSNFRATQHLNEWLSRRGIIGISGVDTRALTRHIRKNGAQNVAIVRVQRVGGGDQLKKAKEKLIQRRSLMSGMRSAGRFMRGESFPHQRSALIPPRGRRIVLLHSSMSSPSTTA